MTIIIPMTIIPTQNLQQNDPKSNASTVRGFNLLISSLPEDIEGLALQLLSEMWRQQARPSLVSFVFVIPLLAI